MRIQHNIPAMNSLTNYTRNNNALAGNLEKLSSGYRINSAADDAAGLAISEKMRSQIKGLEKAYDNANDGISLVQTAEGALTEVNSMLTRLTELATQSANGTYQEEVDREAIQEETDAILDEIDRISKATNFNGINLLDGSLSGKSQVDNVSISTSNAVAGKYTAVALTDATFTGLTVADIGKTLDYTVTWADANGNEKTTTVSLTYQGAGDGTVSGTAVNNYFTDAQGNKYALDSDKLTAATSTAGKGSISDAIIAGLKNDEEFNANFSISGAATLVFDAREGGSSGAKIIGTAAVSNLSVNIGTVNMAGAGDVTVTKAPVNAMQKFDASKLAVIKKGDTKADIDKAIFEIDGHKFVLADGTDNNRITDAEIGALGQDVTVIKLKAGAFAAADDAANIAKDITRVTGLTAEAGTANTDAAITVNDIVFTKDKLKLGGTELRLQIGDTNDDFQHVSVKIQDMSSAGLGLTGLDLSKQDKAGDAIKTIKNAVNLVSAQRGRLGALQNRLDHTLNNLDATTENITSAESQIRDVNMAKEMTAYTKNNILAQAAQSMLAQANSMPQGVLQLLQ